MKRGDFEPAHTSTLAWLLDPQKEHGFGHTLIKSLIHYIAKEKNQQSFVVIKDESERLHRIPGKEKSGRTDIWVEGEWDSGSKWLLIIEAKIFSSEGENQLANYEEMASQYGKRGYEIFRVFLTPRGEMPVSATGIWLPLSFSQLAILLWSCSIPLREKPGYHFLRYYIAGIFRDILGCPIGLESARDHPFDLFPFLKAIHE